MNDVITVANEEPFGKNAVAKVSSIKGVGITTITTTKLQIIQYLSKYQMI